MLSFSKKKAEPEAAAADAKEAVSAAGKSPAAAAAAEPLTDARMVEDRASLAAAGGEKAPLAPPEKVSYVAIVKELFSKSHPYWLGFHGITLVFLCMGITKLAWGLFTMGWHAVCNYRYYAWLVYYVTTTVLFTVMYVGAPIVCLIGDLWIFRSNLVDLGVWYMKKKNCTLKKCVINGSLDRKARRCELDVKGLGVRPDDTTEDIVSIEGVTATATMMKTKKELKNGVDVELLIDQLEVNFITYDMQFKDTNLNRLLTQLSGEEVQPEPVEEQEEQQPEQQEAVGEQRYTVLCRILKSKIEVKGKTPMGIQPIIPPIILDNEIVDFRVFARKFGLMKWINGLVLRTVANSSLDLASNVFKGVGGLATGITGKAFDGVDAAAGYVPGGSIVKGGTGAARSVIGGAVAGGGKIVGGVTGGGKHIVQGLTSGSVSGVAKGFYKAGESVGGGVVGGVASVGGGVVGAGASVGGGFVDAGKGAHSMVAGGSTKSADAPAEAGAAVESKEEHPQAPDSATKKKKSSYMTMFSHKK